MKTLFCSYKMHCSVISQYLQGFVSSQEIEITALFSCRSEMEFESGVHGQELCQNEMTFSAIFQPTRRRAIILYFDDHLTQSYFKKLKVKDNILTDVGTSTSNIELVRNLLLF